MPAIPFDLKVDLATGDAVISIDDLSAASLPHFVEGLSIDLRIWAIQKISGVASYVPTANFTVFAALGNLLDNPPTYYTQQATWTASTDLANPYYYEAIFPMNTDPVSSLVLGQRSKAADFGVFFFVSGSPAGALIKSVPVFKTLYNTTSLTVPAGQTPLSAEVADGTYLKRHIIGPIYLINETDQTKVNRVYTDTDGTFKVSPE